MLTLFAAALLIGQAGDKLQTLESASEDANCANAVTQQDMNYCAAQDFHAADAALNAQWTLTAAEMHRLDTAYQADDERPGYFETLLAAQRAWLTFRDSHCTSEGYLARGGSMEPMLIAGCRAALTRERTEQLRQLADYPN